MHVGPLLRHHTAMSADYYTVPYVKQEPIIIKSAYRSLTLTFDDLKPIDNVKEKIIVDIKKGGNKTIIILPILGGKNTVANGFAKVFNFLGYNTVIIHRPAQQKGTAQEVENALRNNVTNCRQIFSWLLEQRYIDYWPNKTALLGTSLGGINAANLTPFSDFPAYVYIMAGADIPHISVNSVESKNWISKFLKNNPGKTKSDFLVEMEETIKTDPMYLVEKGNRTLMFQTGWLFNLDRSVPYRFQEQLSKITGAKKWRFVTGHYSVVLMIWFIIPVAWLFIRKRL